jgi:hypothetical protein
MQDVSHSGQPRPVASECPWQTDAIARRQDAHAQAFAEVQAGSIGRACAVNSRSEGGQNELGSRESTA